MLGFIIQSTHLLDDCILDAVTKNPALVAGLEVLELGSGVGSTGTHISIVLYLMYR